MELMYIASCGTTVSVSSVCINFKKVAITLTVAHTEAFSIATYWMIQASCFTFGFNGNRVDCSLWVFAQWTCDTTRPCCQACCTDRIGRLMCSQTFAEVSLCLSSLAVTSARRSYEPLLSSSGCLPRHRDVFPVGLWRNCPDVLALKLSQTADIIDRLHFLSSSVRSTPPFLPLPAQEGWRRASLPWPRRLWK